MMAISLARAEDIGVNIEAYTIYVYPQYFWITSKRDITRITSQIKIQRKTHNITQFDLQEPLPANPQKKIVCSGLMGILPVLKKHYLLVVQLCKQICQIDGKSIYQIQKVLPLSFEDQEVIFKDPQGSALLQWTKAADKVVSLVYYIKWYLLIQGYYFAFRYDLSLSRSSHAEGFPSKKKFLWNLNIAQNFLKLQDRRWFVSVIQGSIKSFKVTIDGNPLQYVLITRRSWIKGGTRFNSRGIDAKGNVANFCQTQQIIFIKNQCFSHVQIRGSVPAFWRQIGVTQEVSLDSSWQKNQQAFKMHIQKISKHYNKILCVNLLCLDRSGEDELTYCYEDLVKGSKIKDIRYEYFDVHCASKGQKFQRCNYLVTQKLSGINRYFSYYREDIATKTVLIKQMGVVRVNCLDNLDRTNLIQSKIAFQTLAFVLQSIGIDVKTAVGSSSILIAADSMQNSSIFVIHLKNAWADNGDLISKHYTGTGSTHTNITRTGKRDILGMLDHGVKSCQRLYQQFVDDNQKQEAIDILLGEHTETVNLTQIEARLKQLQDNGQIVEEYSKQDVGNF